jgi:dolichol-phosphate mannosyltransferase
MPIEVRSLAEWEAAGIPGMLSVVIPAHNEEDHIAETVQHLATELRSAGILYEIVVINDNSSDGTERILATVSAADPGIRYVNNLPPNGFGFAVRRGLAEFRGEAVAIVMADGSDDPADVVAFYRKLEGGYDCVFGSRFVRGARVSDYPKFKLLLNRLANLLIRVLFLLRYNDVTNAFKLLSAQRDCRHPAAAVAAFQSYGRIASQMHHPRPQIRGAAEFLEEPQTRHL